MTYQDAKKKLSAAGVTLKKNDYGEYVVNIRGASDASEYYTEQLDDALGTGLDMARGVAEGRYTYTRRRNTSIRKSKKASKHYRLGDFAHSLARFRRGVGLKPLRKRNKEYGRSSPRIGGVKFYLKRKPLNQGGYDTFGRYYGVGQPLWEYQDVETGEINGEFRADNKAHAKEKLGKIAMREIWGR